MQELLGRIAALDPQASLGLRVIACFDELVVGEVNTKALVAAAAALAGCPAGAAVADGSRLTRVDPEGKALTGPPPDAVSDHRLPDGSRVWLERVGEPLPNDALIIERLALAAGIRFGLERRLLEKPRDVASIVDATLDEDDRIEAASRLGLTGAARHRVLAAPLFAVFDARPSGVTDVVSTVHGPLQIVVVPADVTELAVSPAGLGPAVEVTELPRSLRVAIVALRLARPPEQPLVRSDDFGGLVELLTDSADAADGDTAAIDGLMQIAWVESTVAALLENSTVRQAARALGLHHSTVQHRVDHLADSLGYDPLSGHNRTRLGISLLKWRLRTSRVLDLPTPGTRNDAP